MGKYLISDHPMTVEQWAQERATVINEVVEDVIGRVQSCQDPVKIAMIKVVTSMLAGLKRSEEGSLGRHPPG